MSSQKPDRPRKRRWRATTYVKDTRPPGKRNARGRMKLGRPADVVAETPEEALDYVESLMQDIPPEVQKDIVYITIKASEKKGNPFLS